MPLFQRPRNKRFGASSGRFQLHRLVSLFVVLGLLVGLFAAFISNQTATRAATGLPNGTVGSPYFAPLAFCMEPCMEANVTGGTVPPGLSVVLTGSRVDLVGLPSQAGPYSFQLTVIDMGMPKIYDFDIIIIGGTGNGNGPGFASNPKPGQTLTIRAQVGKPGSNSILFSETGDTTLQVYILGLQGANVKDFTLSTDYIQIADGGAAKSLTITCNPSAPGKRTAMLSVESNDQHYSFNDYSIVCDSSEEEKLPADLMLQLRVTPDRQAKTSPETEITFDLKVTNVGPGVGDAVRLLFPIDPNLTPAYTRFSDGRMWVSEKVTEGDKPYLKIAMPSVQPGQSFSATLVFHPKAGAKVGAVVREQFTSGWDDRVHAGMTSTSNAVMVTLVDSTSNRDDTKGAVMWFPQHGQSVELNKSLILTADFYSPNEGVDFWYTDADNKSVQLGMFWADLNGKLTLEFSAKDLTEGKTYTIVGKGRRSGIMGSAAITVIAIKPSNNTPPKDPVKVK